MTDEYDNYMRDKWICSKCSRVNSMISDNVCPKCSEVIIKNEVTNKKTNSR
jgi:rubrerythrin